MLNLTAAFKIAKSFEIFAADTVERLLEAKAAKTAARQADQLRLAKSALLIAEQEIAALRAEIEAAEAQAAAKTEEAVA